MSTKIVRLDQSNPPEVFFMRTALSIGGRGIITTLLFLLLALTVHAEPINIILKSPANGAVITTYTQDFIYDFDDYPSMINCSLIVDDKLEGFRNALIRRNDNKMTLELGSGKHTWYIKCVDTSLNEIISETRTFTVNIEGGIQEGYQTIYNPNGLRSYVITITPGQSPVELPGMKGGEDIQIKIKGKTYHLDLLRMGSAGNTSFVEIRNRASSTIHRMLVPTTLSFDFDHDNITDIDLSLKNVERSVNAYFIVTPYPTSMLKEELLEQEPIHAETENTTAPQESMPRNEEIKEQAEKEPPRRAEPEQSITSKNKTKPKPWLALLKIIIILIILVTLLILLRHKKNIAKKKSEKKLQRKEIRRLVKKRITRREKRIKEAKKTRKPSPGSPKHTGTHRINTDDTKGNNEEFDIITSIRSTGVKRR